MLPFSRRPDSVASLEPGQVLRRLTAPLTLSQFLIFLIGAVVAGTAYCQLWCLVAYPPFHSMPMRLDASLAWAVSTIVPWVAAFEIVKRRGQLATTTGGQVMVSASAFAAAVILAMILELGLDRLLGFETRPTSIQLAAQIPMALLTTGLLAIGSVLARVDRPAAYPSRPLAQLLEHALDIDWLKAAGNYVEVCRGGRTSLHRATMDSLERALDPKRFLRIHRSLIVNRRAIDAYVTVDGVAGVRLSDGSVHKTGERYARNLRQQAP